MAFMHEDKSVRNHRCENIKLYISDIILIIAEVTRMEYNLFHILNLKRHNLCIA
jgi:hypothetical protein